MFKTKSKKMREVVETHLYQINSSLSNFDEKDDGTSVVYQTLIARRVVLEDILKNFDKIES